MHSQLRRPVVTGVLPVAVALLLLAGHAQAQCRGGGQRQSLSRQSRLPVGLPQAPFTQQSMARQLTTQPILMPPQQDVALRQLIALQRQLIAMQPQVPVQRQQRVVLRVALRKQQTALESALRKTTSVLTSVQERVITAQERTDRQASAVVASLQRRQAALEKQQTDLENALQETRTLLTTLQQQDGQ